MATDIHDNWDVALNLLDNNLNCLVLDELRKKLLSLLYL